VAGFQRSSSDVMNASVPDRLREDHDPRRKEVELPREFVHQYGLQTFANIAG
jgi:hypothetical protein